MKSIQKKLTDFDKIQAEQKKKLDKIHALVDKLGQTLSKGLDK